MQESVKASESGTQHQGAVRQSHMVTASYALVVDPTTINDALTVDLVVYNYERNVAVLLKLYESKSSNCNEVHILKLLRITHEMRSCSTSFISSIKEEYPFFGHIKWISKIWQLCA